MYVGFARASRGRLVARNDKGAGFDSLRGQD